MTAGLESVGWVHLLHGKLLAVRSTGRDRFYLPGGKIEPGESHEQALIRAVREKLGVELTGLRPAFLVSAPAHGQPQPTLLTMHCFYADASGQPRPAREIEETAWLDGEQDPRAAPALRLVLRRLST